MNDLFNSNHSDSDSELKINSSYAQNYNNWRQKEELNKLKTKYGEHIKDLHTSDEDSSTSEEEDEDGKELTEAFEKNFYKTLACLKNKDPRIYDEKVTFFDDIEQLEDTSKATIKEKAKNKPLFLRDYERKVMLERDGKFSDSEDEDTLQQENNQPLAPTYVKEQLKLKESFKKILEEDEDDETADLLKPKTKSAEDEKKEEEAYKEWLKGQHTEIDGVDKKELKPLRDFWTDPKLDQNEKFLRDYILNKKFLDQDFNDFNPEYDLVVHDSDENLSEDEKNIEIQEEFEHKYNFRFEEPDQEFIKRYPRTLENSMRRKDTRRAEKRVELKKRKEEEAIRKREELKQLKALKRKEIEEKIEKLKEITGNDDIHFNEIDLDGDFDPAEHDRKMQAMFSDEFYAGPEGDLKPEFPDIDEELDIETTWDKYDPKQEEVIPETKRNNGPHCDDPDFNMDADYDPTKTLQEELIDSSRKKKRRRRNKLAVAVAKEKPTFDPTGNPSYQAYLDQYYALDYEDMIGDQPCRFKYRNVVANDYGLTIDEIIMADDKELNKWCSLKKALQYRPEYLELNDVTSYQQKARNEALKKKIFKSIYGPKEAAEGTKPNPGTSNQQNQEVPKKKRKRSKRKNVATAETDPANENNISIESSEPQSSKHDVDELKVTSKLKENVTKKKNKKRKIRENGHSFITENADQSQTQVKHTEIKCNESEEKKAKKGKLVKDKKDEINVHKEPSSQISRKINSANDSVKQNVNPKRKQNQKGKTSKDDKKGKNKMTHNKVIKNKKDVVTDLSAERLKAYGINPKKFKNKLKYGNKN
ncbi:protein KRI1 homolog [Neodiprion virginianus]|uniref:protein KRI1 homolog n=1 Tax=Neodiprion virginianus TaxID=2961670 RepID=UPI001EE74E46|nr:protein KRI1 homolog [Neodiprion virginianus]